MQYKLGSLDNLWSEDIIIEGKTPIDALKKHFKDHEIKRQGRYQPANRYLRYLTARGTRFMTLFYKIEIK